LKNGRKGRGADRFGTGERKAQREPEVGGRTKCSIKKSNREKAEGCSNDLVRSVEKEKEPGVWGD